MTKTGKIETGNPSGEDFSSSLFGPPPLLDGEDAAAYHELYGKIRDAVNPQDAIEELWARDVLDLFWESLRLRRLKIKLIEGARRESLSLLFFRINKQFLAESTLSAWVRGDEQAAGLITAFLEEAGLDEEAITTHAIGREIKTLETIDRFILQRDACRNAALRELDRRRDARSRRLREIAREIDQSATPVLEPPKMRAAE